ncbi:MAG: enoyl-CoA hydratase/isomerase family protein [Tepidiformaceae bacterium]
MEYRDLILEERDNVALITINRAEKLNAISARLVHELLDIVERAEVDDAIKAIVITGAGHAFSAGADLTGDNTEDAELDEADGYRRMKTGAIGHWGVLYQKLGTCPKPIIAAVNGVSAGAGFSLALAADIRIASTQARFISVFIRRGLAPDTGATFHLPRLIGSSRALEMMMTGDEVNAEQADKWGLVNRVVEPDHLIPEAVALATRIAKGPSVAIELTKRLIHDMTMDGLGRQLQNEAWAQTVAGSAEDRGEGTRAFMEKRPPNWTGR